ncbi:MAG: radical SAM protein [Candidatus Gastranaerophilales bacterium]|nr:radical SAM protein [Candidatus Gastranaerophilales bacterium]
MNDVILREYYDFISLDITSNCNLRCPFCSNDFRYIPDNINMTKKTFEKAIKLLSLAKDDRFMFSCAFEPSINPNYVQLLKMIPEEGKNKCFLTTNLSLKQPEETFKALAESNINYINISLDSLNPVTYESLRKGAKFDNFISNLETMVSTFKKYPNAPKIKFITMVFKQNIGELLTVAHICHSRYLAYEHEFRTPVYDTYSYIDEEWAKNSVISRLEWDSLIENLSKLQYRFGFGPPPFPAHSGSEAECPDSIVLRIDSDGTTLIKNKNYGNINDIENPYEFFKSKLYELRNDKKQEMINVRVYKPKEKIEKFIKDNQGKKICFWGAGDLAKIILDAYDFSKLNVLGFIDGNKDKKGQKIGNYTIYSSADLELLDPEIIVLSVLEFKYLANLVNKILKDKNLKIKVIDDLFY